MVSVLAGGWIFGAFIDHAAPANPSWLHVYWLLAGICALVIVLLASSQLDESAAHSEKTNSMRGSLQGDAAAVPAPAGLRVPDLRLPVCADRTGFPALAADVQQRGRSNTQRNEHPVASILAGATAIGRLLAGQVLRRVPWHVLLNICVIGMGLLVIVVLPLARNVVARADIDWFGAPVAAYLIPLISLPDGADLSGDQFGGA